MRKITNTNYETAVIHLYEHCNGSYMMLEGVEFFDRSGRRLIFAGSYAGKCKEIRLPVDERVVGVRGFTGNGGSLYDV